MKAVSADVANKIIRLHLAEGWPIGSVARALGVHHSVVRRVLQAHNLPPKPQLNRARMIDAYLPFIQQTLKEHPKIHASRLHQMVKARGYEGGESHFRRLIAEVRPKPSPEPFTRLAFMPGEEAQVDWGHFGKQQVGQAQRPLVAFVMTLSWSRMVWLQFFHDMRMASFCRGHIDAFAFFEGVPRKVLYDNLKSAVISRVHHAIHFNDTLLEMASRYRFEPRVAAPRRGNEKGRVERTIRYIRTNFFTARKFKDLDDLNRQALAWTQEVSAARPWPDDRRKSVGEQFAEERKRLYALPDTPFEAYERVPVKIGRTPWARFDTNDYSVPANCVRREVEILADHRQVRVVCDGEVVANHTRSYDKRRTFTKPEHLAEIAAAKQRARGGASKHRLFTMAPASAEFLARAAERGCNVGSMVRGLLAYLDSYGANALGNALKEAHERGRISTKAVGLILERNAREEQRTPATPVKMGRTDLLRLTLPPTNLKSYDQLTENTDEENS